MRKWMIVALSLMVLGAIAVEGFAADKMVKVTIETNRGNIELELNKEKAPKSVDNFVQYAKDGFYNGTVFHRVIPGFMVQGGGLTADMKKKETRKPIQNEADNGLKNDRGTIAMARTADPHSATAQFFINSVNNDFLNHRSKDASGWGYAVFGKVTKGMDVVDAMSKVATTQKAPHANVPIEPIVIKSVKVGN